MPELAEVEMLRRRLAAVLPGRRGLSVQVLDSKAVAGSPEIAGSCLISRRIGRVGRRGTVLIVSLDGSASLLVHRR